MCIIARFPPFFRVYILSVVSVFSPPSTLKTAVRALKSHEGRYRFPAVVLPRQRQGWKYRTFYFRQKALDLTFPKTPPSLVRHRILTTFPVLGKKLKRRKTIAPPPRARSAVLMYTHPLMRTVSATRRGSPGHLPG